MGYKSVAFPRSVIRIDTHSLFTRGGGSCRRSSDGDEGEESGVSGGYPDLMEDTLGVLREGRFVGCIVHGEEYRSEYISK